MSGEESTGKNNIQKVSTNMEQIKPCLLKIFFSERIVCSNNFSLLLWEECVQIYCCMICSSWRSKELAPALAQVSRPGQERYLLFVFYVDTIYQNPQSHQPKFIADFNFPIVILFKFRQTTSNGRAQVMRPAPALGAMKKWKNFHLSIELKIFVQ